MHLSVPLLRLCELILPAAFQVVVARRPRERDFVRGFAVLLIERCLDAWELLGTLYAHRQPADGPCDEWHGGQPL